MKTTFYTTIFLLLIIASACKSIDKLVDQGRYDEAIVLATKKLAGKKNKKTKHIRSLEEAFAKVNERDMRHIAYLRAKDSDESWEEIYDYALKINQRQNKIFPFLPLVSKENYVGSFELLNTSDILKEAGEKAAEYAYNQGSHFLEKARINNDKVLAQEAHYAFLSTRRYFDQYKNTSELLEESNSLGTFHILLKREFPIDLTTRNRLFSSNSLGQLSHRWIHYHLDFKAGITFDAISTLSLDDIDISREREVVNHFEESKDFEKWVEELDDNGNVVKDSTGNIVTYKLVERVSAVISEYYRTKSALITGSIKTISFADGTLVSTERINHVISFESDACTLVGDRRALSDGVRKRIDNTLLPFPRDYEMIEDGLNKVNYDFMNHIRSLGVSDLHSIDYALK